MDKTKIKRRESINKEEVTIKHCTLTEWLNSLRVPSGVAIYRNLPFGERARRNEKMGLPKGRTRGSHHQCLFEENVRKTKKRSVNFENKGSGVVYTWGRY